MLGGILANLVVANAVTNHVYAHVRWGFVGACAQNASEDGVQNGEHVHVAVVVDSIFAVGVQVPRVNHVDVVKVSRCRFVRNVYRVSQRQVPHREGFVLGVAGLDTVLRIVVDLRQTSCHLSATGTGRSYNNNVTRSLYVVVFAKALGGNNVRYLCGVALDVVGAVNFDAVGLQLALEVYCCHVGFVKLRKYNATNVQANAS